MSTRLVRAGRLCLLSHLHDVAVDPNRTLWWHWTEGDVAIWGESCTLHRAVGDHHPAVRRMRRCTTDGERPRPAHSISDAAGGR